MTFIKISADTFKQGGQNDQTDRQELVVERRHPSCGSYEPPRTAVAAFCNEIYRAPYEKRLDEAARISPKRLIRIEFDVTHDGVTREEVCLWLADLAPGLIEEQ